MTIGILTTKKGYATIPDIADSFVYEAGDDRLSAEVSIRQFIYLLNKWGIIQTEGRGKYVLSLSTEKELFKLMTQLQKIEFHSKEDLEEVPELSYTD